MEIIEEVQPGELSASDFATPYDNGDGRWNVRVYNASFVIVSKHCRAKARVEERGINNKVKPSYIKRLLATRAFYNTCPVEPFQSSFFAIMLMNRR